MYTILLSMHTSCYDHYSAVILNQLLYRRMDVPVTHIYIYLFVSAVRTTIVSAASTTTLLFQPLDQRPRTHISHTSTPDR